MVFLLETAAFLQLLLIPGLLVIGLIRPNFGKFRTLLLIPGLSLLVNYVYAAVALACGCFLTWVSRGYVLLTWVLTYWVYRREIKSFLAGNLWQPFQEYFTGAGKNIAQMYQEREPAGRLGLSFALFGCLSGLYWFADCFLGSWDTIFTTWDSALSWNYWATFWIRQEIPLNFSYYPQLIPLNWANAYLIIGRELQFVSRFSVMLFPLLSGLFFADYGVNKRTLPMLICVPLMAYVFWNVDFLSHGAELDMVVVYYSCAVFFALYYLKDVENSRDYFRQLLVIVLLLSAAGSTKQSGLFLLPAAAAIGGRIVYLKAKEFKVPTGKAMKAAALLLIVLILLTSPFYIFARYRMSAGMNISNVGFVTESIYRGRSHFDRFICSCRLYMLKLQGGQPHIAGAKWVTLDKSRGWAFAIFDLYRWHILLGLVMLVFNAAVIWYNIKKRREYPGVLLSATVFFLIWSVFFCYDLRNLALAFPWLVLLMAVGINEMFANPKSRLKEMKIWHGLLGIIVVLMLFLPENFKSGKRGRQFNIAKMQVGYPELNRILYEWAVQDTSEVKRRVVTDYIYGILLPEINNRFVNCTFLDKTEFMNKFNDPEVGAMMIPSYADPSIKEVVDELVANGMLHKSFVYQEYTFYEKVGF